MVNSTSTQPPAAPSLWVLQKLVRVRRGSETWETVSRPISFFEADRRLKKCDGSKQYRILTGVRRAMRVKSRIVDLVGEVPHHG